MKIKDFRVREGMTVAAQQASIEASKTDITSYIAAEKTAEANILQGQADLEQKVRHTLQGVLAQDETPLSVADRTLRPKTPANSPSGHAPSIK